MNTTPDGPPLSSGDHPGRKDDAQGPASSWFGQVRYRSGAVTPPAIYRQLEELLTRLRPAALDAGRSSAEIGADGLTASLVPTSQPLAGIGFDCFSETGGLTSLVGYEEYYGDYGDDGPLSQVMLDDLSRLLRSEYRVNEVWWRGQMVRRVIRGPHPFGDTEITNQQGWLVTPPWLMWGRHLDRRSYTVSYDCQGD